MKKDYTKLWDIDVVGGSKCSQSQGKSGAWHNARPLPYYGLFYRLRDAWNVLWSKADALYWMIDQD